MVRLVAAPVPAPVMIGGGNMEDGPVSSELLLAAALFTALVVIVPAFLLLSAFLGPRREGRIKHDTFESGIASTVGSARQRFSVKFYLVAILFIVFEVETVIIYPWAVNVRPLGMIGFGTMLIFIGLVFTGLIYIVRMGVLDWR